LSPKTCECGGPVLCKGLCAACYHRQRRARAKTVEARPPPAPPVEAAAVDDDREMAPGDPEWSFDDMVYDIEPAFMEALEDLKSDAA